VLPRIRSERNHFVSFWNCSIISVQ
jgi:hypothetical protein